MESWEIENGSNIPPIKVYPDKFEGQVVVITGAGQGIGEVTSKLFASQGATVVLVDIQEDKLKCVQAEIEATGGNAVYRLCNVAAEDQATLMIDWVVATFAKIDVLVQLAALYPFIPLAEHPTADFLNVMNVNVNACFYLTRAVLPHMKKAGYGRLINTSSGTLQLPDRGLSAYVTSKAAIVGFTRCVAVEAGPGVTANIILPGLTRTEAVWKLHERPDGSHGLFETLIQKQCVKRSGRPQDIAHTICFMASPEAQFITGQIFDCGGGATFH
ncbi:NAD(P)-binding protein [Coniochaeta ligniaria NRRL 30616]|uniref:NAD(P)-binding protein n=1 Tax=Coniochaeta ligniaria NRRL 30616 TaxID=1408157 RepID=A0A1J7JP84_9PEZI|nr:NAD(P)-binding protein [Coniochaeta ligniaria NRRL 30616]